MDGIAWGHTVQITASILYDLVHCPQRVALDAFGDIAARDPLNPFVKLLWERGTFFEKETVGKLEQAFLDLSNAEGVEKERLTFEAMKRGEPLIYGGRISADELVGAPDLLRKEAGGYIAGDIKSGAGEEGATDDNDGKPKLHYAVQLALYTDILERLLLSAGRRAFVWDIHGDEVAYDFTAAQGPRKPQTLWDEYQWVLADARAILSRQITPQAAFSSACKLCHWYNSCVGELARLDDLTLIPFLGRPLRDALQGTFPTIASLAATDPEAHIHGSKTSFKGLGPDRLKLFHARAAMLKQEKPQAYLRAAVALPIKPVELFFDIEVDPLQDICYLHGVVERHDGKNETERFVHFFAEEVAPVAERDCFAGAFAYLTGHDDAIIYYYSKYERTNYRKLQQRYPDVCSADDIERLFDPARAIDLYGDVVIKATEWPTRDHSIKTLAKHLGFTWRDVHPSGAASVEWFDRWTRERSLEIKQRILAYNEDDCRATRVLLDGIRSLALHPSLPLNNERKPVY
jgi:predicted RecB family nuclease